MARQGRGLFVCAQTTWITLAEVLRHVHWCHIWLAARSKADVISSGDWSVTIWAMVCSEHADSLCLYLLFGRRMVSLRSIIFPVLYCQTLYSYYISGSCLTGFPHISYDARQIWTRLKKKKNLTGIFYQIKISLALKLTYGILSTPVHDLAKYRNHKIKE